METATDISNSSSKCGFVSILGRPNAGKSTLLNALIGAKVAIVSDKPQTTRNAIQGVLTDDASQIIFVDTPGIHNAGNAINKRMMHAVRSALDSLDLLIFVADAARKLTREDAEAVDMVKKAEAPVILALNKIDRLESREQLLAAIERYRELYDFAEYIPISALTGEGLDILLKQIQKRLPESEQLYPPDYITDQPERYLVSELVREKILHHTAQEVPHATAVIVETWDESKPGLIRVGATIYVERAGQKGIVIGSRGSMLKTIGTEARLEIEQFLGRKVFLELFVKVRQNWREDLGFLNELDWRETMGVVEHDGPTLIADEEANEQGEKDGPVIL